MLSATVISLIYLKLVEQGFESPFFMLTLFLLGLTIMALFAKYTAPDNLFNSEYRYSKKGRKEWEERNNDLF